MNPDQPLWQWGPIVLNATILWTWAVMGLMSFGAWLITREHCEPQRPSRRRLSLEVVVTALQKQIRDVSQQESGPYLSFIGTLFLFIAVANLLSIVPGYV